MTGAAAEGGSAWRGWAIAEVAAVRRSGRWREPRDFDAAGPAGRIAPDGASVVSFASNDYLGLTVHPAVRGAARAAIDRWGTGAGSARLVVGARPVHSELEAELASWKAAERAVLFPTGFAANLGALAVLGETGTLICSDELNHASIVDGCRLSRAEVAVYRHGDLDELSGLLTARGDRRAVVVSDSVFSMDGDAAPLSGLLDLCRDHGALLVLDEAHAALGPEPDPDAAAGVELLRVGTLSKTLGALGGFVAGPACYTDLIVNRARPYIFTTAPAPADAAAALAALRVVRSPEGDDLRARLRAHVDRLRPGHPSPIVPVLCGSEEHALGAARALLRRGLLVPAIRPPTVPAGTSRLRVTFSALHTETQVTALLDALDDLAKRSVPTPDPSSP